MPLFANILRFNNLKKTLAAHKENCEVRLEGHVNTHSNPIPKAGPSSGLGLGLGLSLGPSDELIPNPRSQTSFSDVDFSIMAIWNPNILFEFNSDSESTSDSRVQNDILLRFESDSGVDDEEDIEDPESMENQEIENVL